MKLLTNRHTIRELIGFRDIYFMLVGIPIIGFLVPILFFDYSLEGGLLGYIPKWSVSTMYSAAYWFSVRTIFLYSRSRYPKAEQTWRRIGMILLLFIPSYFAINLGLGFIQACLPGMVNFNKTESIFDLNVASLTVILIIATFYESAYFYARWRESLVEQERLRRQHTESQLEGLKNQVNPHFLFNSLNTLAYIIPEDPDRAVRFVQELSRVYRYILEIRDTRLIPLGKELDFLDAYIFLLKERFGDKLRIEVEIEDQFQNQQIVPLSLQMLFENAIKHNEISEAHPLRIDLQIAEGELVMRNTLRRKKQRQHSTKVGLENIRSRYAFFTDREVSVTETGDYFLVALPLLPARQEQLSVLTES
jgi:two-component system, LytTR family, sensor kinase